MYSWNCPCGAANWPHEKTCQTCGRPAQAPDPDRTLAEVPAAGRSLDLCAVLAVLFGALGYWLLPILFGPAALALGAVSLNRLRDNPHLQGRFQAWAGVLLGIYCTGVSAHRMNAALTPPAEPAVSQPVVLPSPPAQDPEAAREAAQFRMEMRSEIAAEQHREQLQAVRRREAEQSRRAAEQAAEVAAKQQAADEEWARNAYPARILRVRCPRCGIITDVPSTQRYYDCGCGNQRVEVVEFHNPVFPDERPMPPPR